MWQFTRGYGLLSWENDRTIPGRCSSLVWLLEGTHDTGPSYPMSCYIVTLPVGYIPCLIWTTCACEIKKWHAYTPPFLPWLIRSSSRECVHILFYLFIYYAYLSMSDKWYSIYNVSMIHNLSVYIMYVYIYAFTMIYINDPNAVPPGYPPLSHSRGDRFWFLLCHHRKGHVWRGSVVLHKSCKILLEEWIRMVDDWNGGTFSIFLLGYTVMFL